MSHVDPEKRPDNKLAKFFAGVSIAAVGSVIFLLCLYAVILLIRLVIRTLH